MPGPRVLIIEQANPDLLCIHGHPIGGDDVAKVGHRAFAELTLRVLDVEAMILQLGKHQMDVAEVLRPRHTINQDVVEEHKYEPTGLKRRSSWLEMSPAL
jgi:hypothetical protein